MSHSRLAWRMYYVGGGEGIEQTVERYENSRYGTLRTWAQELGLMATLNWRALISASQLALNPPAVFKRQRCNAH